MLTGMAITSTSASDESSRGQTVLDVVKGAAVGVLAAALGGMGDILEGIILVGAAGAALGWIYARVAKPLAGAIFRTYAAVDSLEQLPGFMAEQREVNEETRARLDQGSENFRLLNQRLSLAERAASSVAEDSATAAEHTQALVRELDVPSRGRGYTDD
jgi:hypothetical protein